MQRREFCIGAVAVAAACRGSDEAKLRVFAAASLTDVLPSVDAAWAETGATMPVELVLDATSRLAGQIEAGAGADVFVSADAEWMDTLASKDLVVGDTRRDLVGNRLVVVVPARSPATLGDAAGLRALGKLALAGASVPAGKYARASLQSLQVWDDVAAHVVEADNVRTALAWVAGGEVDAGIVYATDAKVEPAVRIAFELPRSSHPPIVYPVAVVATSTRIAAARSWVAFASSPAAQAIFRDAGFEPLP